MDALRSVTGAALLAVTLPVDAAPLPAWRPFVTEASRRFALPESWILRVIAAESAGRTHVNGAPIRSRVGAMGLMQLMPVTWATMRAQHRLGGDADDPRDNILAGTAYLRQMYDRFGYPGLFGAYNAGPGRYAAHKATGAELPLETRGYMAKIAGGPAPQTMPVLPSGVVRAVYEPPVPSLFVVRAKGELDAAQYPAAASAQAAIFAVVKVNP